MSEGEKLARSFVDAYNQRDLSTALALFADEGMNFTVNDAKAPYKQEVRDKLEEQIGFGRVFEITDCSAKARGAGCALLGCMLRFCKDYLEATKS
jgi:hypothetical protein